LLTFLQLLLEVNSVGHVLFPRLSDFVSVPEFSDLRLYNSTEVDEDVEGDQGAHDESEPVANLNVGHKWREAQDVVHHEHDGDLVEDLELVDSPILIGFHVSVHDDRDDDLERH